MMERASTSMSRRALLGMAVLCAALAVFTMYNHQQRLLCWWINREIQVAGVRLMMPVSEVEAILGVERQNQPGFGGYQLVYSDRGIVLTLLSDGGTEFYHRVSEIKVTDPAHTVFGVRVGDPAESARRAFQNYGFKEEREGYPGLWKMNSFVMFEVGGSGSVTAISVGIKDRAAQTRVY